MFDRTYTTTKTTKRTKPIEYIVIHSTAMPTSSAKAVAKAFQNTTKDKSTNFVVDETSIYNLVEDPTKEYTWHCGAKQYKPDCKARNANSIGVDMCDRAMAGTDINKVSDKGWYFPFATLSNTVNLLVYLCTQYGVKPENIVMHYNVTGKQCPISFTQSGKLFLLDWMREQVSRALSNPSLMDIALEALPK